jgi:DNA-binding response OmpR family regulator
VLRRDAKPQEAAGGSPERAAAHEQTPAHRVQPWRRGRGALSRQNRVYEKGRLRVDFDAYEVFIDGQRIHLFLREFELLRFLVQCPNRVFDRGEILESVWGQDVSIDRRTIDVHVRRLRAAIERDPAQPELIVTVRRVGYKFDERALLASGIVSAARA